MAKGRREELRDLVRVQAESDLEAFIKLVHPNRVLGQIHRDVIQWWAREDAKSHDLLLLPRDHQKSALLGYRCAHAIVKNPAIRVLYISSTSNLATKQLKFIKDILTSDIVRFYWPDLVNTEEAKREKWTETEISVDHPLRKAEAVRDPTVFAAGLTTNVVGLHCDVAALDDVVVFDNAYTEEGRTRVEQQYSLLASIESADALEWVVGTRYDPRDLYATLSAKKVEIYDQDGELISDDPLFDVKQEQVEDRGDGYGQFLWPRQLREDGKEFGFNAAILAKKKTQYINRLQFRAQYYNNPNDPGEASINRTHFQYYDRKYLNRSDGRWHYKNDRLNVFASIDFAFSLSKRSDYSAIAVVGVDGKQNYYVLDLERFKTELISDYYKVILQMYQKWGFRTLGAEVTAAQDVIVKDLKQNYILKNGLALSIKDFRPNRHEGDKEERIEATLQPRYENRQMWHYQGGNCQILEDELVLTKPPHDDLKDALAACIPLCISPAFTSTQHNSRQTEQPTYHSRFGGVL